MGCPAKHNTEFIDTADRLATSGLLKGASQQTLELFQQAAALRSEAKGKVLFLQDDEAEWFYLVANGWVKLFRETLEGSEAVIDVLTTGHIFGETSVFEQGLYAYSAEVVEHTQLIMLPTSVLKKAIEADNQIALNMLSSMSHYRRQQSREIEHLNVQNAPQRIGCFLLRLCPLEASSSVVLNLPYDKTLIASRLGMKPETFSRALAKLKAETEIEIQGPTVTIRNMPQLVSYTCNHCSSSFPCEDMRD